MHVYLISASLLLSLSVRGTKSESTCEIPLKPEGGAILLMQGGSDGKPPPGSIAIFTCDDGRKVEGASVLKCLEDGYWTSKVPKCVVDTRHVPTTSVEKITTTTTPQRVQELANDNITCPRSPHYIGLRVSYTNHDKVNSIATFSCSRKRPLIGSNSSTCQIDGTWSSPWPRCENYLSTCPAFEAFHLDVEVNYTNGLRVDSIARFKCRSPKNLNGNSFARCLPNGTWSDPLPTCEEIGCNKPLKPEHGSVVLDSSGDKFGVGSIAKFSCDDERILEGNPTSKCVENGQWTFPTPKCINGTRCSVPDLHHGDIWNETLGSNFHFKWTSFRYERDILYNKVPAGSKISSANSLVLRCKPGYSIQGTNVSSIRIRCIEAKWMPDPVCLLTDTRHIPAGFVENIIATMSTQNVPVNITNRWTMTTTPKTTSIQNTTSNTVARKPEDGGKYTTEGVFSMPECSCEYPINDENMNAIADGQRLNFHDIVKVNSTVFFRCKRSYRLIGSRTNTCDMCGKWRFDTFPKCIEYRPDYVTCSKLEASTGLRISYSNRNRLGSFASFYCLPPKTIFGSSSATCLPNGVWSHPAPTCEDYITCSELEASTGLRISYSNRNRVGSIASFDCLPPKTILGSSTATCLPKGVWSHPAPACEDVKCKELKENDLLKVQYTNDLEVGSFATFHCIYPGRLTGMSFATCLTNASWSEPTPTCMVPGCSLVALLSSLPDGVFPDIGEEIEEFVPFDSELQLKCENDLILQGTSKAKCESENKWDYGSAQCVSGCRLNMDLPPNLIIEPVKEHYRFGEFILLSCPPGQKLNGDVQRVMCLGYAWSDAIPKCQEIPD